MNRDKVAVFALADTHENHIFGLCPPVSELDGGGTYYSNETQKVLWDAWNWCWDEGLGLAKDYTKVLLAVGDLIENDSKVRSPQELVHQNPGNALAMVSNTFDPIVKKMDYAFIIEGTDAHVGKGAWTEKALARDLDTVSDDYHKSPSWRELRAEFGDLLFDVSHHPGSNSGIRRNFPAVATRLAYDVQAEYLMYWEERPPDIVIRAHNHRFADSGRSLTTRAISLPCFQFKTSFVHRIGKGYQMPDIGMVMFLIEGSRYEMIPLRVKPKRSSTWRIKKKGKKKKK